MKTAVEAYNGALTAFMTKTKEYVTNLPKSDVDSIRRTLAKEREIEKRFKPEWKKWATDYQAAKKDAEALLKLKNDKQKELEDYTKDIFETYQTRINEILVRLGADFKITDLAGKVDNKANMESGTTM